ncbi:MAG: carboxymuconolactone decarboxylase family protein [Acidobacteriaceae bacterium]|nr:carboxymuconolactone decarboxylase family protein [Acidobacteriaceae bacterium]
MRINYTKQSETLYKKFLEVSLALTKGSIEAGLLHLVELRASQMNGCAFCVDMHSKQAKIGGERELRLYHVTVWRESPLFTERERAALEWTELLTKLPPHGVSQESFDAARHQFSEQELSDLTFAIMTINGWNRVSIAFAVEPGSQDAAYGLSKAGLS